MDSTPSNAPKTPLSIYRALAAIEEWTRKGWRFYLHAEGGRWTCNAIGPGLAHADCGGDTFEAAVELALSRALAMEDDPQVIIERYRPMLESDLRSAFGADVKFDIAVEDSSYGPWDAKKIVVYVVCDIDPKEFVDRECKFWGKGIHYPREFLEPVMFSPRFPPRGRSRKADMTIIACRPKGRPPKAATPARCPFCRRRPSGKKFCSTGLGPALMCVCGAQGPPALPKGEEYIFQGGEAERCLEQKAVERWNERCLT